MPTGYTCIIEDKPGCTFRDYALRCLRAFGACVMQREAPLDEPPKLREVDPHHEERIAHYTARAKELEALTPEAARALYETTVAGIKASNDKIAAEHWRLRALYASMRAKVEAFKLPTPGHEEWKRFMLEQIELSIPEGEPFQGHIPPSVEEWLAEEIANTRDSIAYHKEKLALERSRIAIGNKWLQQALDALEVQT